MTTQAIFQLLAIVISICGGIGWLIKFLDGKFQKIMDKFDAIYLDLNDKVSESMCNERRCSMNRQNDVSSAVNGLTKVIQRLQSKLKD